MFDNDSDAVNALLTKNNNFQRLYKKHADLNRKVDEANHHDISIDDLDLENLKKQKLYLKDQMADMIADYKREHAH